MHEIILTPKVQTKIPIEAEVIKPDIFAGKKLEEIEELSVWQGNRERKLCDFFEIEGENASTPDELRIIINGDVPRVKYIGARMTAGEIIIKGDVDMHVGSQMRGGRITVEGNADSFAGVEMKGGVLIVKGNAGDHLGGAYRGEWRGMKGGTIIVEGNAGHEVGGYMQGGFIEIRGSVKNFLGIHMKRGLIVVRGDAGRRAGALMDSGSIVIMGRISEILPSFEFVKEVRKIKVGEHEFAGRFLLFRGDLVERGKGNLIINADKNRHLIAGS